MKQLVKIQAIYLKDGDLIFDFKYRDIQKIEYVSKETENGVRYMGIGEVSNVHVSYGEKFYYADNFKPNEEVLILIDTNKLRIRESGFLY